MYLVYLGDYDWANLYPTAFESKEAALAAMEKIAWLRREIQKTWYGAFAELVAIGHSRELSAIAALEMHSGKLCWRYYHDGEVALGALYDIEQKM